MLLVVLQYETGSYITWYVVINRMIEFRFLGRICVNVVSLKYIGMICINVG